MGSGEGECGSFLGLSDGELKFFCRNQATGETMRKPWGIKLKEVRVWEGQSFFSFIHSFFLSFFLSLSFNVFFPFFCKAFNPEQMISIQIISQAPGLLSDPLRCQWLRSLVCKRSRIPILKRSLGRRWHGRCHFSNSQQPEPTHMA